MTYCTNIFTKSNNKYMIGIYNKKLEIVKPIYKLKEDEITSLIPALNMRNCIKYNGYTFIFEKKRENIFNKETSYLLDLYTFHILREIREFKSNHTINNDIFEPYINFAEMTTNCIELVMLNWDNSIKLTITGATKTGMSHNIVPGEKYIKIKICKTPECNRFKESFFKIKQKSNSNNEIVVSLLKKVSQTIWEEPITPDHTINEGSYGKVFSLDRYNLSIKTFKDDKYAKEEIDIVNKLNEENTMCNIIRAVSVNIRNFPKLILMDKGESDLYHFCSKNTDILKREYKQTLYIIQDIAKKMLCLYNKNFAYCDLKLPNLLYKCKNKNKLDIYIGDLGSIFDLRNSSINLKESYETAKIRTLYNIYISPNTYPPPEIRNFLSDFKSNKSADLKNIYTQKYITWSIGILIYQIFYGETQATELYHNSNAIVNYDSTHTDNERILTLKQKINSDSTIVNKQLYIYILDNLLQESIDNRWDLEDLINMIDILVEQNPEQHSPVYTFHVQYKVDVSNIINEINKNIFTEKIKIKIQSLIITL